MPDEAPQQKKDQKPRGPRLQRFSITDIGALGDGEIKGMVDYEIKRVVDDVLQRPADGTSRKVTLTISITPADPGNARSDIVDVEFDCKSSVPKQRTRKWGMKTTAAEGGALMFKPDSDVPDQGTFRDLPEGDRA